MQCTYTIEIRVDFADANKKKKIENAMLRAARHVLATAQLLSDHTKPQVAVYSDDNYTGHLDINIMDDLIRAGREEIAEAGEDIDAEAEIDPALVAALTDVKKR